MNDDGFEKLFNDLPLRSPSDGLDERMEELFSRMPKSAPARRGWRFIGPMIGFAAGVLVTATLMRGFQKSEISPEVKTPLPAANVTAPAPTRSLAAWAEPRQTVEEFQGQLNGVPVTVERKVNRIALWSADGSSGSAPADLVISQSVTVRPSDQY